MLIPFFLATSILDNYFFTPNIEGVGWFICIIHFPSPFLFQILFLIFTSSFGYSGNFNIL